MEQQKYGHCRRCGKQIILTLQRNGRGWLECEPYIHWFYEKHSEDSEPFYTPDGCVMDGIRSHSSGEGIMGYVPHRCF